MSRWWEDGPQVPCARCGEPTHSKAATPLHRRCKPRAAPRGPTTWGERQRRARAVAEHRAEHGDWCPGWRRMPHYVDPPGGRNPLSADHVASVASTGDESGPLQILCRRCNSSKREGSGVVAAYTPPASIGRRDWYGPSRDW